MTTRCPDCNGVVQQGDDGQTFHERTCPLLVDVYRQAQVDFNWLCEHPDKSMLVREATDAEKYERRVIAGVEPTHVVVMRGAGNQLMLDYRTCSSDDR